MKTVDATGYLHRSYAESLSEWGAVRRLPRAGSWAIERSVPGSDRRDAVGCYPLMVCEEWEALSEDLGPAGKEWVTFMAVPDPLGAPDEDKLRRIFPDHVQRFKTHYVVELERWTRAPRPGHRARLRSAAARVETDVGPARRDLLDQWSALYADLVERHAIRGLPAFSRRSFAAQLAVPGMHVARAVSGGETVAMSLWATHNGHAYYHLAASSPRGYELSAAYAMVDSAIRYLRALGLVLLDLGGAAGLRERHDDGLASFKRGWATAERPAQFCGRILDPDAYRSLIAQRRTAYFPAYRAGELL